MIRNYFKIAFRNLWRHRGFSALNISGLAIGMAAGFLILLYVGFELSYDTMHSRGERIYRVVSDIKTPSDEYKMPLVDWSALGTLEPHFPEIASSTRVLDLGLIVQKGNENFLEEKSLAADSTFFKIFDFKLIQGNPETVLKAPFSIVLTESAAKKYFGKQNPVGQSLKIMKEEYSATITGVMKDTPNNSQIQADVLLSMTSFTQVINPDIDQSWANYDARGFMLLNPGINPKKLVRKFNSYLKEKNGDKMRESQLETRTDLEPLEDVYLYSKRGSNGSGHITNVYIFSIIALFILLIASINFINLTTARSVERAKEVGIRKVIGAQKQQLALQFIGESLIICILAFVLAVGLAALGLPYFNGLAGKVVAESIFLKPNYLLLLFGISLFIGLLAGVYPALVLSSFGPVSVLKGKFSSSNKGALLRKGLVIGQFTISIVLIIGTLVIYNQMNYMQNQDLGFAKGHIVVLKTGAGADQDLIEKELNSNPNILSVSRSSAVPGGGGSQHSALSKISNSRGKMQALTIELYGIDSKYIPQFDIKLVAGRNFSKDFASDSTDAMILNEKTVKLLGFADPKDAIGSKFEQWGRQGQIIGVVKDFHISSLKQEIEPLSIVYGTNDLGLLSLKVNATNLPKTLSFIKATWGKFLPKLPFDYYFLDEFFARQYRAEERFGNLFLNFAALAIFISCLGLLGLAAYSTIQRRREIGIRKIIGASVPSIVNLLSKEFIILVGVAFLIASPIAWYGMHKWLQGFAYRIDIKWWVFAVAGASALGIALLTVSFQAIKAALQNPVKSLRTE